MPRKIIPLIPNYPYSISARCINQEWFTIPISEVWEIMENYLYFIHFAFNIKIKSFVLMSNHFHLIAIAPDGNLSEAMNYFMRETSRVIGKKANRINQIYGARYYRCLIKHDHHYKHAYKYIYRNPIEAGLAKHVLDYEYSTLKGLLGLKKLVIPVEYDEILFNGIETTLSWLDDKPNDENYLVIKNALKKSEFKLARDVDTKKPHRLELEEY